MRRDGWPFGWRSVAGSLGLPLARFDLSFWALDLAFMRTAIISGLSLDVG